MKTRFCLLMFVVVTTIVCCKDGNNSDESNYTIRGDWMLVSDFQCDNTKNIECPPENDQYPICV